MLRTGIGYDSHRLAEGRRLVLGGIDIPHDRGLLGHSDADVLIHALCDALLGAVADGDIGQHFPDKDPQWKNADSTVLLGRVAERLARAGWRILNTDATVIAEAPKLLPHIPSIRARLAEVMGIDVSRVSVKAKTNEGMDAVGRREGISAMAVALVGRSEDGECVSSLVR
jgi:2-C-methyl-D-erythritol 2,4-cyclodiphosphate synthase